MKVTILLGGFFGFDGYIVSRGMYVLRDMIAARFGYSCSVYEWGNYQLAEADLKRNSGNIVIGYSGGGSRATWMNRPNIDLLVTYDPSPRWQMLPLGATIKRAVTYENKTPMFFGLGGGVLVGPQVERVAISESHVSVQFNRTLHERTLAAIAKAAAK